MITVMAEEMRRWLVELVILYFFAVLLGVTVLSMAAWFGRTYARYCGKRTIYCPETGTLAMIEIDALHAALGSLTGDPDIQLLRCSLWNQRGRCSQPCVKQLRP